MSPNELFAKHTERQLGMWMAYFTEKEERPSLSHLQLLVHLMAVCKEIRYFKVKNSKSVKLEDFDFFNVLQTRAESATSPSSDPNSQPTHKTPSGGLTDAQKQNKLAQSKCYWGMVIRQEPAPVPRIPANRPQRPAPTSSKRRR
jgi:hypothetical protein